MSNVFIYHHNDMDGKVSGSLCYYYERYINNIKEDNIHLFEIDYEYEFKEKINPFDIVVSVNRSRVGKSELIFTFRGNDSVTVSIGWSQKIETFFFKRYREGNVNANDTKQDFNLFMKEYLKFD